jgi:hypothetical protein
LTTTLDHRRATTPSRLRLAADLVADLETIAASEGVGVEELVSRLLVDVLPGMVAQRTNRWLQTTLSLAYPIDIDADVPGIYEPGLDDGGMLHAPASSGNEQSPVADDHEALSGDEILQPHAEHQHTARPVIEGASGGTTT